MGEIDITKQTDSNTENGSLVIIQLTPFCNLNCNYCYLPNRKSAKRIQFSTLSAIASGVLESKELRDPINFLFHAGEPLAIPPNFYRNFFDLVNEKNLESNRSILYSIQTNATLISDKWIKLFQENKVEVGVSLDGPDFIHNKNRLDHAGNNTHSKVMKGVQLLQNANIPFGVIMVLTTLALDYPDEIYKFFTEQKIRHIAFNIDETSQIAKSSFSTSQENTTRYKKFMLRFLSLVDQNNGEIEVREFKRLAKSLLASKADDFYVKKSVNKPFDIITFDIDGNFSTFCPELVGAESIKYDNFRMGNIHNQKIDNLTDNQNFKKIHLEVLEGMESCKKTCKYWRLCGGGNPSDKFFEHGNFNATETTNCRVHLKALADVTIEYLLTA